MRVGVDCTTSLLPSNPIPPMETTSHEPTHAELQARVKDLQESLADLLIERRLERSKVNNGPCRRPRCADGSVHGGDSEQLRDLLARGHPAAAPSGARSRRLLRSPP